MHSVIVKPKNDDYMGQSYTIWVTKTSRLIAQNLKHICGITIPSEQQFQEQIKKALGQLEDTFEQATVREVTEPSKSQSTDSATEVSVNQNSSFQSGKGKVGETHTPYDMVKNDINFRQNDIVQDN